MVSPEAVQSPATMPEELFSSPRISFSADFLDESEFISINPNGVREEAVSVSLEREKKPAARISDPNFEFLSGQATGVHSKMLTADELFFEGKLLPYRAVQQAERLSKINLKSGEDDVDGGEVAVKKGGIEKATNPSAGIIGKDPPALAPPRGINWSFLDDDPSPRPPKCTVLWKELLRLKKHQHQHQIRGKLSPSSSSSSSSSSSTTTEDDSMMDDKKKKKKATTMTKDSDRGCAAKTVNKNGDANDVKSHVRRLKKGLERTRTTSIRIRPIVNVPICTPASRGSNAGAALPPLFPLKKAL